MAEGPPPAGSHVTRKQLQKGGSTAERVIVIAGDDRARLDALIRRAIARPGHPTACLVPRGRAAPRTDALTDTGTPRRSDDALDRPTAGPGGHEDETYTLVCPHGADIEANRLSVLAPVGTALLGYRVGDAVEWPVPARVARFRTEGVISQPNGPRWPTGQ